MMTKKQITISIPEQLYTRLQGIVAHAEDDGVPSVLYEGDGRVSVVQHDACDEGDCQSIEAMAAAYLRWYLYMYDEVLEDGCVAVDEEE